MCHERLKEIKEVLICCVEEQIQDLCEVDTAELGEVIDMIKDLEEAIYYCTVTEAMTSDNSESMWELKKNKSCQWNDGEQMNYGEYGMYPEKQWHNEGTYSESGMHYDPKEGKSHMSRKMYMEAKYNDSDKSIQLKELERYIQELSQEITEMINDASLEEKQYLEKKITALASKIGQMK